MTGQLKRNKGKRAKIYLLNGFFYQGVIIDADDKYLILEDRKTGERILRLVDIEGIVIYGENEE